MTRMHGGILPEAGLNLLAMETNATHPSPLAGSGLLGLTHDSVEEEPDWESNWIDLGGEG